MYIKKENFNYFEGLYKGLDEAKKKRFLEALLRDGIKRVGSGITKIQVVGDEIFDERGIEACEFVTKTMIKKAYKAAKEE